LNLEHRTLNFKGDSEVTENTINKTRQVEVTADDLPLHCPMPSMVLWNAHPRVFLPIEKTGEALCPYCGTQYTLKGGAAASGH
jgi:uncharacterized Zn-finger protein